MASTTTKKTTVKDQIAISPPLVPTMIRMPQSTRDRLEKIATDEGRSLSNLAARVLDEWVKGQAATA